MHLAQFGQVFPQPSVSGIESWWLIMWKAVPWYTPQLHQGREKDNQPKSAVPFIDFTLWAPKRTWKPRLCGENPWFWQTWNFPAHVLLSHDMPENLSNKKKIHLKECFSFCTSPKMPHPISLKFSRKLLLWHEIIYMKCKTDWFVVLAKLGRKTNWIVLLKRELGSHLWIITYLGKSCLPWHFDH